MALTPEIRAPQAGYLVAVRQQAQETYVLQATTLGIYNVPTDEIQVTYGAKNIAYRRTAQQFPVTQAVLLAVIRGRTDSPYIRAWTYTLDGHDYYVLHLGSVETLVYDTHAQTWAVWGSGNLPSWRAYTGTNWIGGRALGGTFSNIVTGDDSSGTLYWLDPEGDRDDDAIEGSDLPRPFRREITGQVVLKPGYNFVPCYGVQLMGSIGSGPEGGLEVNLEVSDDRGHTYWDAGNIAINEYDYTARVNWLSLGSMTAPGRLFRVMDRGALKRIDSLATDDQMDRDALKDAFRKG